MRYDYRCDQCGAEREVVRSIKDQPLPVACGCGSAMDMQFSADVEIMAKGGERPYKLDATCMPIGWERGNTDVQAQQGRYKRMIDGERKRARAADKTAIKQGFRKIASVPREFHRMRTNQYGKDYYETNAKEKLRADGLLFTKD